MNFLLRQLLKKGGKRLKDIHELDYSNPITIDTTEFIIEIGKGVLKLGKELL